MCRAYHIRSWGFFLARYGSFDNAWRFKAILHVSPLLPAIFNHPTVVRVSDMADNGDMIRPTLEGAHTCTSRDSSPTVDQRLSENEMTITRTPTKKKVLSYGI